MSDRLFYHQEMLNVLNADSLFFKSLHGYFKGISSDCVLTKSVHHESVFSFLFLKQNQNIYFPCSFFTRNEQKEYTKEGTHWKIISIIEISKYLKLTLTVFHKMESMQTWNNPWSRFANPQSRVISVRFWYLTSFWYASLS